MYALIIGNVDFGYLLMYKRSAGRESNRVDPDRTLHSIP